MCAGAEDGAGGQVGVGGALEVNKNHMGGEKGRISRVRFPGGNRPHGGNCTGHVCGQLGWWGHTGEGLQCRLERGREEQWSSLDPSDPGASVVSMAQFPVGGP